MNDVPDSTSVSSLIVRLVVGLVGLLVITVTVLVIIIVLSVVLVKWCKSATFAKESFYDYVAPPQPPTLPERVQLRENEAYGTVSSDTSPPQVSTTLLQPNIAYGVINTHQGSRTL